MTAATAGYLRRLTPLLLALLPVALHPSLAWARFAMPDLEEVPVERLVANLEKTLDTLGSSSSSAPTPDEEAATRLNLARLHAMAFAKKTETAQVLAGREDGGAWFGFEPAFVPFQTEPVTDPKQEAATKGHLDEAIRQYARVLELDEENLTAALGHAWCVDRSGKKDEAIKLYRKVIDTAWKADGALKEGNLHGRYVTAEAAGYLVPLLDAEKDAQEIDTLKGRIAKLKALPRERTPIAIPLRGGLTLDDIVAPKAKVRFDADGLRLGKSWSWIQPEAGWLVHDRFGSGRIDSALQMFGNVTFWLFWDNGYDALGSLDDNLDGRLAGEELAGLAIWQDANGNGQSDPGEVRPLADWGIESLSCRHRDFDGDPNCKVYSPEGVRFRDGTTRATYDVLLFEQ